MSAQSTGASGPTMLPRDALRLTLARVDLVFFVLAFLLIGYWAVIHLEARLFQTAAIHRLESATGANPHGRLSPGAPRARAQARSNGLIGRIEVPRIDLSVAIAEGADPKTLYLAVGHLPGTAFPGEPGNVALAGHRDTFFRALSKVAVNDTIRIATPDGAFRYVIESMTVTDPRRTEFISPTSRVPMLTLVTCYPFHHIGPSPKRFIVQARQIPAAAPEARAASS